MNKTQTLLSGKFQFNYEGFPSHSDGKESTCNAGDTGSIPGLGISPGEGNGYPLQYSCLGNPMNRGKQVKVLNDTVLNKTSGDILSLVYI